MPSIESFFMQTRKQEESCGRGVPLLNSVGDACVNQRSLMRWYVWMAASTSSWWMPTATRMSMCCGRSTTWPLMRSRYDRSSVCVRTQSGQTGVWVPHPYTHRHTRRSCCRSR